MQPGQNGVDYCHVPGPGTRFATGRREVDEPQVACAAEPLAGETLTSGQLEYWPLAAKGWAKGRL